jgi:hypothetical protein
VAAGLAALLATPLLAQLRTQLSTAAQVAAQPAVPGQELPAAQLGYRAGCTRDCNIRSRNAQPDTQPSAGLAEKVAVVLDRRVDALFEKEAVQIHRPL